MCFTHYELLSRVASERCASNNNSLCAAMSSCSNSCQISFFRHRDTAETDVPKSVAISVSVFPAKDISHAVKIVFVFERRILNSPRKCYKSRVSTLYAVNSTLLNATCQIKITKTCSFLRNKRITHQKKCEIRKKTCKIHTNRYFFTRSFLFFCRNECFAWVFPSHY